MSVIIGSARSDERGKLTGGKAGDQTGQEVSTQAFYMHSKGWNGFRARDKALANKLAEGMKIACNNNNIGYDQNERLGAVNKGIQTTTKAEADCSSLTRAVLAYAGVNVANFTTATAKKIIMNTGLFDQVAINSESDCQKGDILCTKTKGHIVIVVDAPQAVSSVNPYPVPTITLLKGSQGIYVKWLQWELKNRGYNVGKIDGDYGNKTAACVRQFQKDNGLVADSIAGPKTISKIKYGH